MAGQAGRDARFEALVREVVEPVRRYLARRTDPATAQDVLSDTLLVLWRRLEDVPADASLPWTYAVARGCLANAERAGRRQQRVAARLAAQPPADEGHGAAGAEDAGEALRQALGRLRTEDAELLRLWAWEGLGPADIAQVLGISGNAAGVRLHRARQRLRAELGKDGTGAGHEGDEGGTDD